jgi:hypothetical protein
VVSSRGSRHRVGWQVTERFNILFSVLVLISLLTLLAEGETCPLSGSLSLHTSFASGLVDHNNSYPAGNLLFISQRTSRCLITYPSASFGARTDNPVCVCIIFILQGACACQAAGPLACQCELSTKHCEHAAVAHRAMAHTSSPSILFTVPLRLGVCCTSLNELAVRPSLGDCLPGMVPSGHTRAKGVAPALQVSIQQSLQCLP